MYAISAVLDWFSCLAFLSDGRDEPFWSENISYNLWVFKLLTDPLVEPYRCLKKWREKQKDYYFRVRFFSQVHTWTSSTHSPPQCVFWLAVLLESCPGHWRASFMEFASHSLIKFSHSARCSLFIKSTADDGTTSSLWGLSHFYCRAFVANTQLTPWSTLSCGNTSC